MPGTTIFRGRSRSRRGALLALAIVTCTSGWQAVQAAPVTTSAPPFAVPDAALVRPLGEIPSGTCAPPPAWQACQGSGLPDSTSPFGSVVGNWPMDVPGLGVPLGGVGAGSFMINQSGTFGPWNFGGSQDDNWEMRILPQAAFHVRQQLGSGAAVVKTLATAGPSRSGVLGPVPQRSWGSPLPAWNLLQPGQASYAALYPFGWMTYHALQTDVSMRFFSPIVAGQDRDTSLPVAYFDVRLANPTHQEDNVSVMFTMPNAPDYVSGTHNDEGSTVGPASVRTGFDSRYQSQDGVAGVTLSADSPRNTPDARDTEWTIAARPAPGQKVTYTTSWDASGSGADVYRPFSRSGDLPDKPLDHSASAGAVAVSAHLSPGQATTIPFVLSWDFPQVGFDGNQTIWMRRYTDFYGARETSTNDYVAGSYPFHQGYNLARDALVDHDAALQGVLDWWQPIADNPAYPPMLRCAALNQLYQLVFNDSFWEGGLVSNTVVPTGFPRTGPGEHLDADRPGSHLFGIEDGGGGGQGNELRTEDIQSYDHLALDRLFPNLQKGLLAASVEANGLEPHGNTPDLYTPDGDPFITWGNSESSPLQGGTDSRAAQPGLTEWLDSPSKYIYEWYAYARSSGDTSFLRSAYPAIRREITYLQGTIPPGNHLPLDPAAPPVFANIYDVVPQVGFGLYNSELYLLALQVGIAAGRQVGSDPRYLAGLQADLTAAKAEFEQILWNPVQHYYRFTSAGPDADALFLDAFFAEHLGEELGLPDLVDPAHHRAELIDNYGSLPHYDAAGEMLGAPMLVQPGGVESPTYRWVPLQTSWVWPGTNFMAAADYYATGKRTGDPALEADALQLGTAVATQVWGD
ncbi:MAG TPA: GH116 family glycosyl-hydrolase, partial [Acidimicrobiales bacterium]|nr:GH116 family glycosyl-hydrolase [Acidimicrobiales bacterium]